MQLVKNVLNYSFVIIISCCINTLFCSISKQKLEMDDYISLIDVQSKYDTKKIIEKYSIANNTSLYRYDVFMNTIKSLIFEPEKESALQMKNLEFNMVIHDMAILRLCLENEKYLEEGHFYEFSISFLVFERFFRENMTFDQRNLIEFDTIISQIMKWINQWKKEHDFDSDAFARYQQSYLFEKVLYALSRRQEERNKAFIGLGFAAATTVGGLLYLHSLYYGK